MNNQKGHKVPFTVQRAIVCYVLFGLLFAWSTGALWNHVDSLKSDYGWLMKAGLFAVDFAGLVLITWHLFGAWIWTRVYCFAAHLVLGIGIIVHAGGVVQLDASKKDNADTIAAVADGQAKIAEAATRGAVTAAGDNAVKMKQAGGTRRQVGAALKTGEAGLKSATAEGQKALADLAGTKKAETFLPESYRGGVMYVAMFVGAFLLICGALAVTEWGAAHEDVNRNGIPDHLERAVGWKVEPARGNLYQFDERGNLVNAAEGITEEEARRRVGGRDPWPDAPAPVSTPAQPKPRVKSYPTTGAWDGWKRETDNRSH